MKVNLFVYGTLMPGQRADYLLPKHLIKQQEKATIKAEGMFTQGSFPIVILHNEESKNKNIIKGVLLELEGTENQINEALSEMDSYEGVPTLYVRNNTTVNVNGKLENTIVYSINPSRYGYVRNETRIESGDWLDYLLTRV